MSLVLTHHCLGFRGVQFWLNYPGSLEPQSGSHHAILSIVSNMPSPGLPLTMNDAVGEPERRSKAQDEYKRSVGMSPVNGMRRGWTGEASQESAAAINNIGR